MTARFLHAVVIVLGAVGVARPVLAQAPPRASAEIDASALADESAAVTARLDAALKSMLLDREVLPATSAADARLRIRVELGGTDDEPAYDVTLELVTDEGTADDARREFTCSLCTHGDLVERTRAEASALVDRLVSPPASDTAADAEVGDGDDGGPSEPSIGGASVANEETPEGPVDPEPAASGRDDARPPIGPLGISGITIGAAGLGGVAAGAALIATPSRPIESTQYREQRVYRPPGGAALGIGAAFVVTGATLLVIDRVRAHRRRAIWNAHSKTPTPAVDLRLGPSGVGVAF